ncbi:class I SAM-dependent methyltransferase [Desulfobacter vibrioformis]|uniref:class I SAM-dependent methyltransferase n=1 Tax=Desulfobacter vibrioformis TaxID=34031 RepID=UPI000551A5AE|nr:class I SAM-dependent methyltransferase [Desulfobacter vibrioformis]
MGTSCIVCQKAELEFPGVYGSLPRVGSDSRPLPPGGGILGQCMTCGTVQKVINDAYRAECKAIYASYVMYGQSAESAEPKVFDGRPNLRSVKLVCAITRSMALPVAGSLLDVGCGNGNLLRSFKSAHPGWKLTGLELDGRHREAVAAICGGSSLRTGQLADVTGRFDLITAMHVLEHMVDPVEFLCQIRERLTPDGAAIVQLPLWQKNPFDLVVADHAVHYNADALCRVLNRAGFRPVFLSDGIIPRELTVIARPGKGSLDTKKTDGPSLDAALGWLSRVSALAAQAMNGAGKKYFGIFGTGNAAMWTTKALAGVNFYVDEDPTRQGINLLTGKQVYAPEKVPEGSTVFISLPPDLSESIKTRLRHLPINWLTTPPLEN